MLGIIRFGHNSLAPLDDEEAVYVCTEVRVCMCMRAQCVCVCACMYLCVLDETNQLLHTAAISTAHTINLI